MQERDESIVKPSYPVWALVFMTVLTQISLGGFFILLLGDAMSILGYESANWMIALLVMLPAGFGLPLSVFYLRSSYFTPTAMKQLQTSWLSREALALGVFFLLMNAVVILHFFEAHIVLRICTEATTLAIGIYGIYAQVMIYRVKTCPAWDREITNIKFFGVTYIGSFLVALLAVIFSMNDIAIPLLVLGILGALAQTFFSLEDLMLIVESEEENGFQLKRAKKLYAKIFHKLKSFRLVSIILGGVVLPLLVIFLLSIEAIAGASIILFIALILVFSSELSDRYLFFTTATSLGITDGFIIGNSKDILRVSFSKDR